MENNFDFYGKIKYISNEIIIGTFKKLEIILTTEEQYPQHIKFELHKDKCDLVKNLKIGDELKIWFNIRGKEWVNPEGKSIYFSTFVIWKLQLIVNGYNTSIKEDSPHIQHQFNFPPASEVFGNDEDYDDLPF